MPSLERYLRLTRLAQKTYTRSHLEWALQLFSAAEREAQQLGDRALTDRAFCNRCVVLLELDRLTGAIGELKNVLLRSRDPFTSWMAAYYTAQVHEAEGNIPRALTYARRASELATTCQEPRALAASANQHGVLALRDGKYAEAAARFVEALQIGCDRESDPIGTAITRDNLGYCRMCLGEQAEGMTLCADAAAALEAAGARSLLAEVYQDLCFGCLKENRIADGQAYGERALLLAREFCNQSVEKHTLMLLADAALDSNDEPLAETYLAKLTRHYPDSEGMKAFLRSFDMRQVINLKA